jgi:hypothetical protein
MNFYRLAGFTIERDSDRGHFATNVTMEQLCPMPVKHHEALPDGMPTSPVASFLLTSETSAEAIADHVRRAGASNRRCRCYSNDPNHKLPVASVLRPH